MSESERKGPDLLIVSLVIVLALLIFGVAAAYRVFVYQEPLEAQIQRYDATILDERLAMLDAMGDVMELSSDARMFGLTEERYDAMTEASVLMTSIQERTNAIMPPPGREEFHEMILNSFGWCREAATSYSASALVNSVSLIEDGNREAGECFDRMEAASALIDE